MESTYLHSAFLSLFTKGLLSSFHPWRILHWNSSWLPWLLGYLNCPRRSANQEVSDHPGLSDKEQEGQGWAAIKLWSQGLNAGWPLQTNAALSRKKEGRGREVKWNCKVRWQKTNTTKVCHSCWKGAPHQARLRGAGAGGGGALHVPGKSGG